MEQQVDWYIPDKVLYAVYPPKLDIATLVSVQEQILKMLNEATHPVYVISDLRQVQSYPMNVGQIKSVIELVKHPNNIGININHNRAIKFMISFVPRMLRSKIRLTDVNTFEEAIDYIKNEDSSIDWSLADNNLVEQH